MKLFRLRDAHAEFVFPDDVGRFHHFNSELLGILGVRLADPDDTVFRAPAVSLLKALVANHNRTIRRLRRLRRAKIIAPKRHKRHKGKNKSIQSFNRNEGELNYAERKS